MLHGEYIGDDARLKNQKALLQVKDSKTLLAQFDNVELPEAFKWRPFSTGDFEIEIPSW